MAAIDATLTSAHRWRIAARRAGTHSLVIWPPITLAFLVVVTLHKGSLAFDLSQAYLPAAHKVLHGQSPYPLATASAFVHRTAFVYPPLTAWLVVPFALLSVGAAEGVGFALMVAGVIGLLLLLGVRDWRCHMIALLWLPTYTAVWTANLALPIAVGLAALWRFRDRRGVAGLFAGVLIAAKLYVWPIGIWLVATRRYRAAVGALVTAIALVVSSWAAIGFAGMRGYPHLLSVLTRSERYDGYTIAALLAPLISWRVATLVGTAAGLAVLAGVWSSGRRGDDRRAFVYAIAATLMLTPIVWMSYFVALLVVVALYAPRLNWLWALPLGLWVGPQLHNGAPWQTAAVLALAAATVVGAARADAARGPDRVFRLGRAPRPVEEG